MRRLEFRRGRRHSWPGKGGEVACAHLGLGWWPEPGGRVGASPVRGHDGSSTTAGRSSALAKGRAAQGNTRVGKFVGVLGKGLGVSDDAGSERERELAKAATMVDSGTIRVLRRGGEGLK
jgi:hypothetical protein